MTTSTTTYRVHDLVHQGRLIAEFPTLAEAQAFVGDLEDICVMRCDEGDDPYPVWET
jgi:hypothetical protein